MTIKIESSPSIIRPETASVVATSRAGASRTAPVSATVEVDSMHLTGEAVGLQRIESQQGKSGVDLQRVERIRQALADGTYTVNSQKIADAMIGQDEQIAEFSR